MVTPETWDIKREVWYAKMAYQKPDYKLSDNLINTCLWLESYLGALNEVFFFFFKQMGQ
jgi:hypothetical protein